MGIWDLFNSKSEKKGNFYVHFPGTPHEDVRNGEGKKNYISQKLPSVRNLSNDTDNIECFFCTNQFSFSP